MTLGKCGEQQTVLVWLMNETPSGFGAILLHNCECVNHDLHNPRRWYWSAASRTSAAVTDAA